MDATARPWPGTLSSRQARWSRYQRRGDTSGEASDGEKADSRVSEAADGEAIGEAAVETSDGGAAIEGYTCWRCCEAFKAPIAVPIGPVQAKGPGCVRPPPDTPGTLLLSGRADSSGAIGEAADGVGAAGKAVK